MRIARRVPPEEASEQVAETAPVARTLVGPATEPSASADATLPRVELAMNLLLRARFSADALASESTSERDRLQVGLLASWLDEALAEQRILWLDLASTMASSTDGPSRYRDVTRRSTSGSAGRPRD